MASEGNTKVESIKSIEVYCHQCPGIRKVENPKMCPLENGEFSFQGKCSVCNTQITGLIVPIKKKLRVDTPFLEVLKKIEGLRE